MSACFYGASILSFIVGLTTILSYMSGDMLYSLLYTLLHSHLPGAEVIKSTMLQCIPPIIFYSFFLVHILSYLLRIFLNYYNISINEFNRVPHIVSFIGPLVCKYQYWYFH